MLIFKRELARSLPVFCAALQNLKFDQDILTDWAQAPVAVPQPIIAQATVLSEQEGAAALKLRRRFMRQGYAMERNEGAAEDELADDQDGGEKDPHREDDADHRDEPAVSSSSGAATATTPPERGASSSAPPSAPDPASDADSDSDELLPDILDQGFHMSLSLQEETISDEDRKQYAAFKFLEQVDAMESETEDASENDSSAGSAARPPPAWMQAETPEEKIALEKGKKLVEMYDNTPLEDLDPAWFLLVFLDHFPNGTGLPPPGVSIRAWLRYLIQIDGSLFQLAPFLCAAGDWILRHEVNLAAYLQFKVSPSKFARAALAEVDDAKRVGELLAKRQRPKTTDTRVVHDLYSSLVAVASRTPGSALASMRLRRRTFAGWGHFGMYTIFFTINKLETRSPYCWRLAGCADALWKYPAADATSVPPNKDMEMINLVRAHPVAQNTFFEIGIKTFREVCCGFSHDGQYAQEYENGKPKGFFGPLDAAMQNREQSGRKAHHGHGQMISRLTKLHLILETFERGAEQVIKWMASNACMVMGDYVMSLRPDGTKPATVKPALVEGMPENVEPVAIKRRPKNWLLSCEMPEVNHLPPAERLREMTEYAACLKATLQIHEHSSRCIGPTANARGDDTDCSLGYKPGPPCEPVGRWDAENQELYLPRDRTKLIVSCNEVLLLADRCNHNCVMNGDRSARMANRATETRSFISLARQNSLYNTKYDTKMDDLSGEQLIFNLAAAQQRTIAEEATDGRKTVVRLTNAMHK